MTLQDYRRKRDFRATPEPGGKVAPRTGGRRRKPRFVVHKHDASRLHYDLRLEMEGVLKSWAVPKGPSLNPADKRLAVMVEDHPLEYGDFEGTIPKGEYGAGTVMIWDEGAYETAGGAGGCLAAACGPAALDKGELKVNLSGKKLRGGWVLVRTRWRGEDKNWLLIKEKDDFASARGDILQQQPDSARSGRSMEQIAQREQ
jgi:DNA ligase D-like protein (predicted 3'-phosphoesterase)